MATMITVEMGGHRKRCAMIKAPRRGNDGGLWSTARLGDDQFAITKVGGVWCKHSVLTHICKVLDKNKE